MANENTKKLSKKAEQASKIAKEFPREAVLAAAAMERTARYRRTTVIEETQYAYEKIY